MTRSLGRLACAAALLCVAPAATSGQSPDTLRLPTLPPITVTVTRAERPLARLPLAVQSLDRAQISRAKPTWGLDEALADVQGQFTNIDLGEVDRIEVLRGSASALFGNASGGVINISTRPPSISSISQETRFVAGSFGEPSGRTWNKWQSTTGVRVGGGSA